MSNDPDYEATQRERRAKRRAELIRHLLPAPAQAGQGEAPRREYLEAKAAAAGELYADGKITRAECFKHEVDVAVQRDSGPIQTPPTSGTEGKA